MREILYLDAARAELDAAVLWYRDHRTTGVAEMFLADVADAILQIAELPDAWPVSKIDARVRVRPGYWLDRL